jgi:hypothetical protein
MSDSAKTDKLQIIGLGVVCFGLLAFSIPLVCAQLMPSAEVILFDAPGQNVFTAESKASYIIYREKFLDDEKSEQDRDQAAAEKLKFVIVPEKDPRADSLELTSIQNEYIYRAGRRKGLSLYSFDIKTAGRYSLKCYYPQGVPGPKLRMSLGEKTINSASMRRTIVILIVSVNGVLVITVLWLVRKMLEG